MKATQFFGLISALAISVIVTGCASTSGPDATTTSAAGQMPPAAENIRAGDLITVTFSDLPPQGGIPDFKDRVKDDGTILLPLGVRVEAAGKTAGMLQQTIEASYVPRYFKRLTVSIKNEERFFFVGGEVRQPVRQIYASGISVLQAIDSAGGFNEFANKRKVILRRVNGQQFRVDCIKALSDHTLDLPVYPGDSINVPKRSW